MADVRTTDGVVQNQVDPTPVDNRQRIAVAPDAFGAPQAEARQKTGQIEQQIGQEGFSTADHFAAVQTDDQVNKWMGDANSSLDEFRNLEGQARLNARPQIEKKIQDSAQVFRGALKLPAQQAQFDRQIRTFQQNYLARQFSQLNQQADKTYKAQVAKTGFEQAINMAAVGADDPLTVASAREMARGYAVNMLEAEGNDADNTLYQGALQTADRKIYKSVVEAVGATDPQKAIAIAEDQKDALGADYHTLVAGLRTRVYTDEGNGIGAQAIREAGQQLANPEAPRPSGIRQAIYDQEGGPVTNPTQIQPKTWDQWAKQGLVHEGEKFGDPAAMKAVGDRAMAKYEQDYKLPDGTPDTARVAVAWFSGPGNVAPAGAAQPYLNNFQDQNGKSVDSYVNDISTKMGGSRGLVYQAKATAYDRVMALTRDKPPEVQDAAIRRVDREIAIAQTASLETEKAVQLQSAQALRHVGDAIAAGQTVDVRRMLPNATEQQVQDMEAFQRRTLAESLNGSTGDYGPGYADAHAKILSTGPDRIVNPEQLIPLARAGKLNAAGFAAANKELTELNKPGEEATKALSENFYKSLRQKVTIEFPGDNYISPERAEAWNKALPLLQHQIAEGRAKGLTNAQLMDPASKDYVGKVLGAPGGEFLPSAAEVHAAQIEADRKAVADHFDLNAVKSYDELKQAYKDRLSITKEQVRQIAIQRGWTSGAAGAPPPVPVKP